MKLCNYAVTIIFLLISIRANAQSFYQNKYTDTNKSIIDFSTFKGQTVMVVNIATRCGFTGQLDDIEKLYKKYQSKKFKIVGFPSSNFGGQTPESNDEVGKFCRLKYGATFPIIEKQNVIGNNKTPIYKWLNSQKGFESEVAWNFEKFIIGPDGRILGRFPSQVGPLDKSITSLIEKNIQ
ncbi:MAG: glutathione peroxidase [Bacteriovorax sp.]|nr:glutathione peroxidase [Bacteriovorax sp.]